MTPRMHALTIDVEDYFHATALDAHLDRAAWSAMPSRIEASVDRVLNLLARAGARGTFFVLGWVAERFPHVTRAIVAAGHEIGAHSYWHRQVFRQSPDEFRADLRRVRDVLEDQIGLPVRYYRAPSFSITRQSLWALEILAEEGFRLDASIFPIRHDRYGIPDAPLHPYPHATAHGALWEFPPTVAPVGPARIPVGGGGYFRLLPYAWSRWWWRWAECRTTAPLMFYFHPWELDADQPACPGLRGLARWRHRGGLGAMERKLARWLAEVRFAPIGAVLPQVATACAAAPPVPLVEAAP
jgi:polysaccharide deacetylase family protein (PEP-CTERM system associated)